jgi:hypothetical protein
VVVFPSQLGIIRLDFGSCFVVRNGHDPGVNVPFSDTHRRVWSSQEKSSLKFHEIHIAQLNVAAKAQPQDEVTSFLAEFRSRRLTWWAAGVTLQTKKVIEAMFSSMIYCTVFAVFNTVFFLHSEVSDDQRLYFTITQQFWGILIHAKGFAEVG